MINTNQLSLSKLPNKEGFEFVAVQMDNTFKKAFIVKTKEGTHTFKDFTNTKAWIKLENPYHWAYFQIVNAMINSRKESSRYESSGDYRLGLKDALSIIIAISSTDK
jgi:hypothetical protein